MNQEAPLLVAGRKSQYTHRLIIHSVESLVGDNRAFTRGG
jgi:hypothetical protein